MRKLMWFAIGFCGACGIGAYLNISAWLIPLAAVMLFLTVAAACLSGWKRNFRVLIPAFLGIALGFGWFWGFEYFSLTPIRAQDNDVIPAEIEITDYSWETEYGVAADGELLLNGKTYKTRAYLKRTEQLVPGDVLSGTFRIRVTNGGQEADTFHSGEGIFLLAYQRGETEVRYSDYLKVKYYPAYLRFQIQSLINECFPEDTAAFARALLLGDDTDLDYPTDTSLKISGIRHIVAVSGLHITILFSLVYNIMGRKRFLSALIGIPVLVLFAAVVGFTPSVTRACIMQILMILALLFNREYDPASALSAACLTMVAANPLAITSVSLQLSAGCMIGIFYITPKIKAWMMDKKRLGKRKRKGIKGKLLGGFVSSVSTSLGATILTTPLSALYFGSVSTIGILSNLLTLWAVSLIFYGIIFACGLGAVWAGAGSAIAAVISWLIRYVLLVANYLSDFPLAAVYTVADYTAIWLIICYLLMLGVFFVKKLRPLVAACLMIISLCISLLFGWFAPRNECVLTVLDVGQGQCILFQSEGKTYLVDCGGSFEEDTADLAAESLLSQGIKALDGIILTHYDNDHAGGTAMLLTRVASDLLVAPEAHEEDRDVLEEIRRVHTGQVLHPAQDILIQYGNTAISVFAPEIRDTDDQNGLCVLFQTENCDILITGDRDETGERMLLQRRSLPELEVLVVGHHGSKYSTSQLLLDSTSPQTAIISVGADNSYGHPTEEVLQRLQAAGCEIYRTDLHGTIIYKG